LSPSEQGIGEAIIEKDATLVLVDVESGEFIDEPKLALTALRERAQALIQRSRACIQFIVKSGRPILVPSGSTASTNLDHSGWRR
jgi:hypothetical protein